MVLLGARSVLWCPFTAVYKNQILSHYTPLKSSFHYEHAGFFIFSLTQRKTCLILTQTLKKLQKISFLNFHLNFSYLFQAIRHLTFTYSESPLKDLSKGVKVLAKSPFKNIKINKNKISFFKKFHFWIFFWIFHIYFKR